MAERRYPHPMPSDSIAATIGEIAADGQRLVKLEVELAKQEIIGLLKTNAIAIGMLSVAALSGIFVLYTLVAMIVFGALSFVFQRGMGHDAIALLVILVIWLLVAVILGLMGKSRLVFKLPESTIQTIKDDVAWAKAQIKPETK
ncbi:MAG: phage holin family protein [Candidatus Dormibacteria bacterium]